MTNKKTAIVLGGTNAHIELINNLKNRGFFVVLIDYYDNPPAKKYADEHIKESTLDKDKVLEIAKARKANIVISTSVDQANAVACYVGEKLGLPIPYSYETALNVTNKLLMKKIMIENNIPTARFCEIEDIESLKQTDLKFPLVIKPIDSNGSSGVRKLLNISEFQKYFELAKSISRSKKVLVEEYKEGIEISVDVITENYIPEIVMIRQKFKLPESGNFVLQSPGSFSPSFIENKNIEKLKNIIEDICKAFNLKNTSLLVQAIYNNEGISIIEFAPRVGGGMSYKTILLNTGLDIIDKTIDSYLEVEKKYNFTKPKMFLFTIIVYAKEGVFEKIEGVDELKNNGFIIDFFYYKTKGMKIGNDMSTSSRIGAFIVAGKTYREGLDKIEKSLKNLEVYDENNEKIMLKNIYENIYLEGIDVL